MIRKQKKIFTLDSQLGSMIDNNTKLTKGRNWDLLVKELKKFNINVNAQQKKKIVDDSDNEELNRILNELMEYDNNIVAMPAELGNS